MDSYQVLVDQLLFIPMSTCVPDINTLSEVKEVENNKKIHRIQHLLHIKDKPAPIYAEAVLPTVLRFHRGVVSTSRRLSPLVRFGPVEGIKEKICLSEAHKLVTEVSSETPVFLKSRNSFGMTLIDVSNKNKSNWFSLLKIGDQKTANLWLYEEDNELYAITTQFIAPRSPLILGYSKEYAEQHGIPAGHPVFDLNDGLWREAQRWWCYDCRRLLPSSAKMQRHNDFYHKEESVSVYRRYRCKCCPRTFSRLFTAKKHMLMCSKKKTQKVNTDKATETTLDTANTTENNKIINEHNLNNYSSHLDNSYFFETDRVPNLDTSGSSKSEEFSSYFVENRNDISLTNNFGVTELSRECYKNNDMDQVSNVSPSPLPSHAVPNENHSPVVKNKLQQRTRFVPVTAGPNDLTYNCDKCTLNFKRRGMLVNHLWRVHKSSGATIPLEQRERRYPCVACPKVYRAAAKRDAHVRNHHPDAELFNAPTLVGDVRTVSAAACPVCPRQYSTRAKLLQHVRKDHPHLGPPVKEKKMQSEAARVRRPSTKCRR